MGPAHESSLASQPLGREARPVDGHAHPPETGSVRERGVAGSAGAPTRNAMTIDVEDYFHVSAFENHIPRASWDSLPCRVERNLEVILGMLHEHRARATFFTLGWIAERYPSLVRRIVEAGHELASHGYAHGRASDQSREEFADDIRSAKRLLEDIAGAPVYGYRAPSFSIGHANMWAMAALADAGYRYSSSIYPIRHDHYGAPDAPRFAYRPQNATAILEIPVTTVRVWNRNLPAGGGGYFRLVPYSLSSWCLRRVNKIDGRACVFYFHPWEIDPEQPRQHGIGLKTRFRHYVNLSRMRSRIEMLLRDFHWDRMDRIFLGERS
jgi:polysaccharide deacetylase family protein (PEP-CTERM system associated)